MFTMLEFMKLNMYARRGWGTHGGSQEYGWILSPICPSIKKI